MTAQTTYQKLAIYVSRDIHLKLKLAAIGEHRSLSDFAEELLSTAMTEREASELLATGQDDDKSG
jgi:hypothetical protein